MITAEAAGLALKIAKGVIKLAVRTDLVLAEREAVQAPLALPAPDLALGPSHQEMREGLKALLERPFDERRDPLGTDREVITRLLQSDPSASELQPHVEKHLPELATGRVLDLNGEFIKALRAARPEWATDPELRTAAFFVGAGTDFRNKSYAWRLALTVVDVLAEFGAENTALFVRDEKLQGTVAAVLRRFAEAEVQTLDTTAALLRAVLKSSLNGALDARAQADLGNECLNALLDAVVTARSKADDPDNFVMGLVRGQSYPLLISTILETSAVTFSADQAGGFGQIASMLLSEIAPIVGKNHTFKSFFNDHWGDLLRVGLKAVERHGPGLVANQNPLLGKVLSAMAHDLAARPNNMILSRDAVTGLVDAVVATVASNPDRIDELLGPGWLTSLVSSVAGVLSESGIQASFTKGGIEAMLKSVLKTFADQPELILERPGLAQELMGDLLKAFATVPSFQAGPLAATAVAASLETISRHPQLLDSDYRKVVAGLATQIAALVKEKKLSDTQARDLVGVTIGALAENPALLVLGDRTTNLVCAVIATVTEIASSKTGRLLSGSNLVDVARQVLDALAVSGKAAMNRGIGPAESKEQLAKLLQAGVARAEAEIGIRMSCGAVSETLGRLVIAWAQGNVTTIDPDDASFSQIFAELAVTAQAARV